MISSISWVSEYIQTSKHKKGHLSHLIRDHLIRVPLVPIERHILNEAHINVAEKETILS